MATAIVPPIYAMLLCHGLKLSDLPVERIAPQAMSCFVAVLMRGTILPATSRDKREYVLIYGVERCVKLPSATHLQLRIGLHIGCVRRMTSTAIENRLSLDLPYLLQFLSAPMNIISEHSAGARPLCGDIELSRFRANHFLFGRGGPRPPITAAQGQHQQKRAPSAQKQHQTR